MNCLLSEPDDHGERMIANLSKNGKNPILIRKESINWVNMCRKLTRRAFENSPNSFWTEPLDRSKWMVSINFGGNSITGDLSATKARQWLTVWTSTIADDRQTVLLILTNWSTVGVEISHPRRMNPTESRLWTIVQQRWIFFAKQIHVLRKIKIEWKRRIKQKCR